MSAFWQAKIWGLLHAPALKALHHNTGQSGNSFWLELEAMQEWREKGWNPEETGISILEHIHLADYIASASDRGAIGSVSSNVDYAPSQNPNKGLEISHLLSGAKLNFKIKQHSELLANRQDFLRQKETQLLQAIPEDAKEDIKQLFWWLWRCLPEAACQEFRDESLMLIPAESRLPDSSIWSHASLTAALAGALAGYNLTSSDIEQKGSVNKDLSHAYLATFSFSPVQEQIKASRKMRDFWAGSWILHYLSAKISWELAKQYGPDSLLYPSLYQQPLIDHWLLREFPQFSTWVKQPSDRALLTAGFPNVLMLVLPKDKVAAAMATAEKLVLETWRDLSHRVFEELQGKRRWMPSLPESSSTWKGWLDTQWQTYWTAIPIGQEGEELKNDAIAEENKDDFEPWVNAQNQAYNLLSQKQKLFQDAEIALMRQAYQQNLEKSGKKFSVNIGSWWPHIFDQTRLALSAIKNARTWQIPTAFGPRSTISGVGPVVHPGADWITEGETRNYWQRHAGLFDGTEQLNATETVKRGLEKILPQLLAGNDDEQATQKVVQAIAASYPDLSAGVAGYLKVSDRTHLDYFHEVCRLVKKTLLEQENLIPEVTEQWGIPWIDDHQDSSFNQYPSRFLNAGWLVEDLETREVLGIQKRIQNLRQQIDNETDSAVVNQYHLTLEQLNNDLTDIRSQYRLAIQKVLDELYSNNNPANWYVLAAGDGDGMSEWLKGRKLKAYREYTSSDLSAPDAVPETFENFLDMPKRMGPSTHNALSRALLDFSNQLVPYLTERRYAGRLIYGGGDDVLAYTNLWEWDKWLWDIRQCFRGDKDPGEQFASVGDYWQWVDGEPPRDASDKPLLSKRPLFTMGQTATISFGITLAHHSVPLAIALENLWEAESEAKKHQTPDSKYKDAVQVRILYGNGNILKATAKFEVLYQWQQMLTEVGELSSSIFEQAASLWSQHPCPDSGAIAAWTKAFCLRRDFFQGNETLRDKFQQHLSTFLDMLWRTTLEKDVEGEIQNWLKLAAFVLRNRNINIGGQH